MTLTEFLLQEGVTAKLNQIAVRNGFTVTELLDVIKFETGGSFETSQKSGTSEAIGLIQFHPDKGQTYKTISGKKYEMKDLSEMSALEQLDVVGEYFDEVHTRGNHPYITVAAPYLGEKSWGADSAEVKQNPSWVGEDGTITANSIMEGFFRNSPHAERSSDARDIKLSKTVTDYAKANMPQPAEGADNQGVIKPSDIEEDAKRLYQGITGFGQGGATGVIDRLNESGRYSDPKQFEQLEEAFEKLYPIDSWDSKFQKGFEGKKISLLQHALNEEGKDVYWGETGLGQSGGLKSPGKMYQHFKTVTKHNYEREQKATEERETKAAFDEYSKETDILKAEREARESEADRKIKEERLRKANLFAANNKILEEGGILEEEESVDDIPKVKDAFQSIDELKSSPAYINATEEGKRQLEKVFGGDSDAPLGTVQIERDDSLLGKIGGIGTVAAGIAAWKAGKAVSKPMERPEMPELSDAFKAYMTEQEQLSKLGMTPEQEAEARSTISEAYTAGMENIRRGTGGDAAKYLSMAGSLDANRQKALLDLAAKDAQLQQANREKFGKLAMFKENFEQQRKMQMRNEEMAQIQARYSMNQNLAAQAAKYAMENIAGAKADKMQNMYMQSLMNDVNAGKNVEYVQPESVWSKLTSGVTNLFKNND